MSPTSPAAVQVRVGKIPFEVSSMSDAVERIIEAAHRSDPISVRLSNAYCVALEAKDSVYAALLNSGGLNFPDGTPVVWFMNSSRRPLRARRVRGPSLFVETIAATSSDEFGHFFLGTTTETLNKMTAKLADAHPQLVISGSYSPPFAPLSEDLYEDCAREISRTDAKIVWVALGTPKQDFLAEELSKRVGRPCIAVGAAFDFVAGTVKEAPIWIQNSGFEWLYRLAAEPKRLWRRYLIGNLQFLQSAISERSRNL